MAVPEEIAKPVDLQWFKAVSKKSVIVGVGSHIPLWKGAQKFLLGNCYFFVAELRNVVNFHEVSEVPRPPSVMEISQNSSPVSGKNVAGRQRASRLLTFLSSRFERSFDTAVETKMSSPRTSSFFAERTFGARITKFFLAAIVALGFATIGASSASAQGWFSDYVLVSVNGGATEYKWIGGNPNFGTQFASSTFTVTYGQTINFGADMRYWWPGGGRSGGALYWRIGTSGTFNENIWTQTYLGGNDFQGKIDPPNINVAAGLSAGTHTVQVWAKSWGTGGDSLLDNSGSYYVATIQINKANQGTVSGSLAGSTINFGSTTTVTASGGTGTGAYEFQQNGGTGAVSFSGSGSSRTISATTAGTAVIEVRRLGDTNYNDSAWVSAGTLTINKASQTITFNSLTAKTFGDANFSLSATASSGLAVSYTSSNTSVATVSGSTVTIVGAGSTTITASQAGNSNYNAASDVAQTLTVNKANQATVSGSLGSAAIALNATTTVTASGGSGTGAYEFRQSGGTGTVSFAASGNPRTVTGTAVGTAPIEVRRVGDGNYNDSSWASAGTITINAAATAPEVTTGSASSIAQTTATLAGNVVADGGSEVTERGFVYSTSDSTPTIAEGATKQTTTGTTGAMSQGVSGLTADTTYYFNAYATNSVGITYGTASSFTTLPNAPSAPGAPTGGSVTTTGFTASWSSVSGATSYRFDVSTANSFATFVSGYEDLTVNGTSQAITGLTAGTTYYVRVRAVNTGGTSSSSGTLTQITVPAAPGTPTSSSVTASGFTVSWSAATGAVDYRLDVSTNNTFTANLDGYNNLTVSGTSQAVTGLTAGTTYYVRVRAVNAGGTSDQSGTLTQITLPAAPSTPTSASLAATSFTVNWGSVTSATSYRLDVATDSGFTTFVTNFNNKTISSGTTDSVTGLTAGTTYYVRVRAVNAAGAGANSATLTQVTVPAAPGTPSSSSVAPYSFTANWTAVTGATDYRLDVSTSNTFAGGSEVTGYTNLTVSGTSQAVTGLSSATTYYVRVRAVNPAGTSGQSGTLTVTTSSVPGGKNPTTANPTTARIGDAVTLKIDAWKTFNSVARSYATVRGRFGNADLSSGSNTLESNNATPGSSVDELSVSVSRFTQTGTFYWALRVSYGNGVDYWYDALRSGWSDLGLNAPSNSPLSIVVSELTAPSGQGATATSGSQINLSWTAGGSGQSPATVIFRSTSNTPPALSGGTTYAANTTYTINGESYRCIYNGSGASHSDSGLTVDTQYYYYFFAANNGYYSSGVTANATTQANYVYPIDSGTQTEAATLTGSGSLTKSGNGELVLTATDSTYAGGTIISAGTLRISNDRALGAVPGTATAASIQIGAATLALDGTITLDSKRGITLTGNAVIDDWGNGGDIYNGIIATANGATTSLTKEGGGNLTLGGNNTYTGLTTVNNGTLTITHANALGATGENNRTTVTATDGLRIEGGVSGIQVGDELLTINGVGPQVSGADSGALRNVSGNNSWSGAITLGSNARINADSGTKFTQTGGMNLASNTLFVGGAGDHEYSGTWSNAGKTAEQGALYKNGAGNLTLSGTHSDLGIVRLVDGGLTIAANATFSANEIYITAGKNLTINESISVGELAEAGTGNSGTASIANGKTLTVNGNNKGTFYMNSISGSGGNLTFSGTGTSRMQLFGTQGYTGITTISSGILGVQSGTTLATSEIRIAAGAEFSTLNNTLDSANFTVTSGKVLAGTSTSGTATVRVRNASTTATLTLASGSTLRFQATGTTTASVGKITVVGNLALNANAVAVNVSGAALPAGTYTLLDTSNGTITSGSPGAVTITGTLLESGLTARLSASSTAVSLIVAPVPVVTADTFSGTVGVAFNRSISATQSPTSYAITSGTLPAGLNFNTSTGAITGTPTTAASGTTIEVTATNAAGTSAAATITFNIAAGSLPTVTFTAPASLVYDRTAKTYLASATGPSSLTLTYTGRNGTTYESTTAPTDAGEYTVTATSGDGNYTGSQAQNFSITAKGLTVTGLTGNNKVYDRTTAATASGTAALSGVIEGDTVTLTGTPTFTFASANVDTGTSISTTGYTLGGAQAGNYSLTQPTLSANITAKGLTVTGLTGDNKVYDRTTAATASGTAELAGIISGDTVTLTGTPTFTFASANVGTGISISTTGYTLGGAQAGNYSLTQPTLSANITAKALTISGAAATNRVYDGTTTVAVSGGSLVGVESGDTVTLGGSPTGTLATATAGTGKSVTVTGYSISGASAANYSLTQPTGLTVDIAKATPTITTAPTASAITQGQALSASNLSGGTATGVGGGALPGNFAFTSPGTTPAAGTASQGVTFTPTDTTNYNTATTTVSVTVNAGLPEGATVDFVNGEYVILDSQNNPLAGVSYTYAYTGRSVGGLTRAYSFINYSSSTAPTAPGFYTVAVTASGDYAGTLTDEFAIAGPLALPSGAIEVTKTAGVTTVRFNRTTLLGTLQRVAGDGTLATGATGLTWTATTAGTSQMPNGYDPATQANTVTHSSSFVTLTPPGAGASTTDSFTLTVSDGATPVTYPVTVTSTAAPAFDLQIRKLVPVEGDATKEKAIFLTRPNRNVNVEFFSPTHGNFVPVRDKNAVVSSTSQASGDVLNFPAAQISTGSSGVVELMVPAGESSMSFRAKPVAQ